MSVPVSVAASKRSASSAMPLFAASSAPAPMVAALRKRTLQQRVPRIGTGLQQHGQFELGTGACALSGSNRRGIDFYVLLVK